MKPLTTKRVRPGLRVRAFQGPNAGRWGTIIGRTTRSKVLVQWDN